jgi:hypothetical protein
MEGDSPVLDRKTTEFSEALAASVKWRQADERR